MPSRADILGFENEWQKCSDPARRGPRASLWRHHSSRTAGLHARDEARGLQGQGKRRLPWERDFADIVTLIDGRPELLQEVATADPDVRTYIASEVGRILKEPRLMDGLAGAMRGDAASDERVDVVILPALTRLSDPHAT